AQDLGPSFVGLGGPIGRGGVRGTTDAPVGALPEEVEAGDTFGTANNAAGNFGTYSGNLYHLMMSGSVFPTAGTDGDDYFKVGALQAGDVITITMSGSSASRGALTHARLYLYRDNGTAAGLLIRSDEARSGTGND